jgi:oxygen-dependent protoporphyrinogen oxidase
MHPSRAWPPSIARSDIAHSLAGFGFLVPRREQRKILGCLFSSSMFDGRAPPDTVLLTSFVGGARHPELPAGSDAEIAAIVHGDLQALLGARSDPAWTAITRWTQAIPQYNLGHRERLRPVGDAEAALPGFSSARATVAAFPSATASNRRARLRIP